MAAPKLFQPERRHRFYEQLTLRGPTPRRLVWHPRMGAHAPRALVAAFNGNIAARLSASLEIGFQTFHQFTWLSVAQGQSREHRRIAQALTDQWIAEFGTFHPQHWTPSLTAERLTNLLFCMDILLEGQDGPWRDKLLSLVARHIRHLRRVERRLPIDSDDALAVASARTLGAMCLPDDPSLGAAISPRLDRILQKVADGVCPGTWRFPVRLHSDLKRLEALSGSFAHRRITPPANLANAISTASEAFAIGLGPDGLLGPWHGVTELQIDRMTPSPKTIAMARRHSDALGRWRLSAQSTLLLVDSGHRRDPLGTGSFSLFDGEEPIIVNCGSPSPLAAAILPGIAKWQAALATTAAGSSLDGLENVPSTVRLNESSDGQLIELQRSVADKLHRRRLLVRPDGNEILGEDQSRGDCAPGLYRFHLPPGMTLHAQTDQPHAILQSTKGARWSFETHNATLTSEETVFVGRDGEPVPSIQLVIKPANAGVRWALRRITK